MKKALRNGFIGDDIQIEVLRIKNDFKELYNLIKKYNSILYDISEKFENKNITNADAYLFVTFTQLHKSFQSFVILLEYGLYDDSQILLRSFYDKMISFLYIINYPDEIVSINQSDLRGLF